MSAEPDVKRAVVFIDGRNLFHSVRGAFGYGFPNVDSKVASATRRAPLRLTAVASTRPTRARSIAQPTMPASTRTTTAPKRNTESDPAPVKRPRLLIEGRLPAAAIGVECLRERGSASALAPYNYCMFGGRVVR